MTEAAFKKNVEIWGTKQPHWARLLEKITCSVVFFTEDKRNLTAEVDGVQRFFYPQDRIYEAGRRPNTKTNHVLFLYGIGLGYHYEILRDWLHEDPKRRLIVFEDNLEVIHRFFETDLAAEFLQDRQTRLEFITWPLYTENPNIKELAVAYCFDGVEIVCLEFYNSIRADRFVSLKEYISSLLWSYKKNYIDIFTSSRFFYPNFFRNLELLPTAYLASSMKGKFSGIPAIICGAGPSLSKNAALLKTLSDRALIFGPGTSMNALNSLGIIPHFGVGIDPNEDQYTRILSNTAFEVPFFYRNRIYPEALELVQADRIYVSGAGFYTFPKWFEEQLGIETLDLDEGNNVINFSLSIAEMLGCNPIILVGVDLAYTDNQSYAADLKEHALSHQANYFVTKAQDEELIIQKDMYGKPIYTLWKWVQEANWIGSFAKKHSHIQLINATEGGIGFPDIPNATLAETASEFMKSNYDFRSKIHHVIQESGVPASLTLEKCFEVMNVLKDSLENCRRLYLELAKETSEKKIDCLRSQLEEEIAEKVCINQIKNVFTNYLKIKIKHGSIAELAQDEMEKEKCLFLENYIREALKAFPDHFSSVKKTGPIPVPCTGQCLYYANGALKVRLLPDGEQEYFYENGVLKTVLPKFLDGPVQMFYPDGSKKREVYFKEGKREGFDRFWSQTGQLLIEAEYKDDKPIHLAQAWYDNGQPKLRVIYNGEGHEQEAIEWDSFGAQKKPKGLDYFDQLIVATKSLAEAIDFCFLKIEEILNNMQIDASEFSDLKKDLALLKEANHKIQQTFSKESFKEPIWKSDLFQKQVHHQISGIIEKMVGEVNNIYQLIEKMVKERHGQF